MKRLMISGFGCPRESWLDFLGPDTTVITLHDVLEVTQSADISEWALYVADEIRRQRPDSIVAHDFGGTATLKALMDLQNETTRLEARLTLLNTAFRDFDVLKNPHPFFMQILPWTLVAQFINASGGDVDMRLKTWLGTIRVAYRRVISASFAQKMQRKLYSRKKAKLGSLDFDLGLAAQIIASPNDPYMSLTSLRSIQDDFLIPNFHIVEYGHFPYSSEQGAMVQQLIHNFEVPRVVRSRK